MNVFHSKAIKTMKYNTQKYANYALTKKKKKNHKDTDIYEIHKLCIYYICITYVCVFVYKDAHIRFMYITISVGYHNLSRLRC